jgi:hypothetical protein
MNKLADFDPFDYSQPPINEREERRGHSQRDNRRGPRETVAGSMAARTVRGAALVALVRPARSLVLVPAEWQADAEPARRYTNGLERERAPPESQNWDMVQFADQDVKGLKVAGVRCLEFRHSPPLVEIICVPFVCGSANLHHDISSNDLAMGRGA